MKGHTGMYLRLAANAERHANIELSDIGTLSILWSQPVTALQILCPDGNWRYVKHIPNGIVSYRQLTSPYLYPSPYSRVQIVNAGDSMEMLSGGFYKATIHRVIQPPVDQRNIPRLGIFYFTMAKDDTKLVPFTDSALLQKEGVKRRIVDEDAPTMGEWRKGIIRSYGFTQLKRRDAVIEEEIVNGIVVKHYN